MANREFTKEELRIFDQIISIDLMIKNLQKMRKEWLTHTTKRHRAIQELMDYCDKEGCKTDVSNILMEYEYYLEGERNISQTGSRIIAACKDQLAIIKEGWQDE